MCAPRQPATPSPGTDPLVAEPTGHRHPRSATHTYPEHGAHDHAHPPRGLWERLTASRTLGGLLHGHGHEVAPSDELLMSTERGIRAVRVSLVALLATAALQLVVVAFSGSAALLADTIHNLADALTALPLWLAYRLGQRPPTRRFTYGFGRAEDLAGVLVVAVIGASAVLAGYESWRKLIEPQPIEHLGWVAAAAVIGFLGNETVALYRIREGRAIGSAALVADGQHAQADGLTSLAVLLGAAGVWAGFPLADPLVGLLITVAILFIARDAALTMGQRLLDAVDPALVARIETTAAGVPGVQHVEGVRVRWLGHRLQAELHVLVDEDLPTRESHAIGEAVRHALFHALPRLAVVMVHVDPCGHGGTDPHAAVAHHTPDRPISCPPGAPGAH